MLHAQPSVRRGLLLVVLCCIVGCGQENTKPESAVLIVQAKKALADGDKESALEALAASIEADPSAWAYAMRARLYAESGKDDLAKTDVQAGLVIDKENAELKWIQQQLKRPVEKRFQDDELPTSK